MCPTDEILRAKIDGELRSVQLRDLDKHLAACATCRDRVGALARQANEAREILGALRPLPDQAATDAHLALARFKAQQRETEVQSPSPFGRLFARRWRPVWAGLAAACLALALLSFSSARGWAQRVLAMLRVQKVTVVPIDLNALDTDNGGNSAGKMLGKMLSDDVVVTIHNEPHDVASAAEASQRAGYHVRLLGERADAPQLTVEGEQAFHMTVDRERAQAILAEVGHPEVNLPSSLDGAVVAVHVPSAVVAKYGNCPKEKPTGGAAAVESEPAGSPAAASAANAEASQENNCLILAQVPSPTVSVPPDLNTSELAEAGLQVAGMSPEQAHAFCQTIDWTSTLVIPIPRSFNAEKTVSVDDVEGTLISFPRDRHHPAGYMLVWVKNGMIYSLIGFGDSAGTVSLADTLN